jgi:hypothetical protein
MHRIALSIFLSSFVFAGGALAHSGHGAPAVHAHAWEYVLLAAAIAAAVGWFTARK